MVNFYPNLTPEQIQQEIEFNKKGDQIKLLKRKLEETDYVANKLSELLATCLISNDFTALTSFKQKYSNELKNREEWRKEIDKLQEEQKAYLS